MATKTICDDCGSDVRVGRFFLSIAVGSPHEPPSPYRIEKDVCPTCYAKILEELGIAPAPPGKEEK